VHRQFGFSLIETVVATSILAVAVAALAQVFAIATRANVGAHATTYAAILAEQKMEQLRALAWSFDAAGTTVSDTTTDTTSVPERPTGGRGLTPSPAGALTTNVDGYCDFVDASGTVLGGGTAPPANTVFIRRWSIDPLPGDPTNALVLQVLVTRNRSRGANAAARLPEEARLVSVRTRTAP
jgi:prepilin-type N-terminal cleavage/methylation domain-containing protein